jgi:hypothetical protein
MKKIKSLFAGVVIAIALAIGTSAFAATNTVTAGKSVQTVAVESKSLFNAGEFGLSLASGYDLGTADTVVASGGKASTLFGNPYTFNLNAGVFYFPWRNLGFEANVPFYQTKGVSVDEVSAGLLFRLPLAKETPILRNISPYVGASAVYNWQDEQDWSYIGKAGVELRLNKKWGVFTEAQYRNYEFKNWGNGAVSITGGLKFVF